MFEKNIEAQFALCANKKTGMRPQLTFVTGPAFGGKGQVKPIPKCPSGYDNSPNYLISTLHTHPSGRCELSTGDKRTLIQGAQMHPKKGSITGVTPSICVAAGPPDDGKAKCWQIKKNKVDEVCSLKEQYKMLWQTYEKVKDDWRREYGFEPISQWWYNFDTLQNMYGLKEELREPFEEYKSEMMNIRSKRRGLTKEVKKRFNELTDEFVIYGEKNHAN